jgi:hypothetical protein
VQTPEGGQWIKTDDAAGQAEAEPKPEPRRNANLRSRYVNRAGGFLPLRQSVHDGAPRGAVEAEQPAGRSFPYRVDGVSEGATCKARLSHDVVFLGRSERRMAQEIFDTSHIDRILA